MRAALIAEGKSDRGLVEVLARLCQDRFETEIEIEIEWANDLLARLASGTTLERKISTLLRADPEFDLLFIHRDADKAGIEARSREITVAAERCGNPWPVVSVIPVREMEAWLLVDEQRIRNIVGNPEGTADLRLPKLSRVEDCTDAKQVLRSALQLARGTSRKRKQRALTDAEFGLYRSRLLEDLDIRGPVAQLQAWQQLVDQLLHYAWLRAGEDLDP